MTVIETAEALGLKVRTIREWLRKGKLPYTKQGKYIVIPSNAVYSKEVQDRANKSREHSRRIKESRTMGVRK